MAAEEKKDINWINAMKAICMIFVLYRHCSTYYGREIDWMNSFSSLFYVTGFFFVSGYLLFWKQLSSPKIDETVSQFASKSGKGLLGNIFHRIMVPTMVFSLIEFVPKTAIRGGATIC